MTTTTVYANMLAKFEADRLDDERLRRIVEAGSLSESLKMLGDYGYPSGDGSVDGFVVAATNELIGFVSENAASESVKNALLAPFVYNNVKLAYKSRFVQTPDAYYDCGTDNEGIARGVYDELENSIAATVEKLDDENERAPQKIDFALTAAMYKYVLGCGVKSVRNMFAAEIDFKNMLTAARMIRLGISGDEFLDGGRIKKSTLENVTADEFAESFERTPYAETATRIAENGFSELWRAERDTDEFLLLVTEPLCESIGGYEPFLHYYIKTRVELKKIKTALVCVKTNARAEFYKRVAIK